MDVDWQAQLIEQGEFYMSNVLLPRLDGLTDDEYFWEPVDGCWSIRASGDGTFTCDWASPAPSPPPVTTIAWRMGHLGASCFARRTNTQFGDGTFSMDRIEWPGTAADAIAFLERHWTSWRDAVAALKPAELGRNVGPTEGPYSETPLAGLILHLNRELFHHGGEIALLRDLYRASHRGRTWRAA